jgi:hypothetical protein
MDDDERAALVGLAELERAAPPPRERKNPLFATIGVDSS